MLGSFWPAQIDHNFQPRFVNVANNYAQGDEEDYGSEIWNSTLEMGKRFHSMTLAWAAASDLSSFCRLFYKFCPRPWLQFKCTCKGGRAWSRIEMNQFSASNNFYQLTQAQNKYQAPKLNGNRCKLFFTGFESPLKREVPVGNTLLGRDQPNCDCSQSLNLKGEVQKCPF